jgi:two-component system response regulator HydG
MTRALVADDDAGVRFTLTRILEDAGVEVEAVADGEAALARAREDRFDLVVSDLRMPKLDGLGLLRALVAEGRVGGGARTKLILMTAHGSERHAVLAMKLGAFDYFRKPFDNDELLAAVRRATEAVELRGENDRLRGELGLSKQLLFASPAMSRLAELVRRVGPRDVNVLLTGESGTGKERVAEAIVAASKRADKPFVRFNCAALATSIAEAELFGHAKGAFTGAVRARLGLFRDSDGGTLLLDEIGDLDLGAQAKLLRVLQSGEVRPLGEERDLKVDVRVLAATHRDLDALVAEKKFREDLAYRLRVVHLEVPPLRERPEDVPLLARAFVRKAAERFGVPVVTPSRAFLEAVASHAWPGNVRELENAMEKVVALSDEGELDATLLPSAARVEAASAEGDALPDADASLRRRMDAYERGLVIAALQAAGGNRSEAARALGIGRATLHEKIAKHRIA